MTRCLSSPLTVSVSLKLHLIGPFYICPFSISGILPYCSLSVSPCAYVHHLFFSSSNGKSRRTLAAQFRTRPLLRQLSSFNPPWGVDFVRYSRPCPTVQCDDLLHCHHALVPLATTSKRRRPVMILTANVYLLGKKCRVAFGTAFP